MNDTPPRNSFPIARRLIRFAGRARRNWLTRHQNRFNFAIHMIGIPLSLLVAPALLFFVEWWWAAAAFLLGYVLQWIGHRVEGNDVGELIPIKKVLGMKSVSVAPQFQAPSSPGPS